ncbi:MAG: AHH domain-containing protein [Cloacibacterium sp.]|uniref:AHH domain-containing protein n=1 Tax=Cloacibacterium sp. TaxID=1913682 RepID=UPI003C7647E8
MIPFAGAAVTGVKLGRKLIQVHHIVPKAIYKEFLPQLTKAGVKLNDVKNLKKLPVPFHGNHPAYNHRVREGIQELVTDGKLTKESVENLQKELRYEINDVMKSGEFERMNHYYKELGYKK